MINIAETQTGKVEYRTVGEGNILLVLNGGHTDCRSPFMHEDFFLQNGYKLIIPSRPGYGKTPSSSGRTAEVFADTLSALLDELSIAKVTVIGISAGGRPALCFAKSYPQKCEKLILESAVTSEKWPDKRTKFGARIAFNKYTEGATWAMFRAMGKIAPDLFLGILFPWLTSLNSKDVIKSWNNTQRRAVLDFLMNSRSGAGFLHDISDNPFTDFASVTVPTLVIASKNDRSVSPENSIKAAQQIKGAELYMTDAESHLIWFSRYKTDMENKIVEFAGKV